MSKKRKPSRVINVKQPTTNTDINKSVSSGIVNPSDDKEELTTKNDFLKTVYEQCNQVYTTFVGVRFQILSLFISNAALFYFIFSQKTKKQALVIFIAITAIFLTWIIFFIDRRNRHIFRRAVRISSKIEAYFNIPVEMRLHTKTPIDLKSKFSHSIIFGLLTIVLTAFWVLYIFFHDFL